MAQHDEQHQLSIIGPDILDNAPLEYWKMITILDLTDIDLKKWGAYSLSDRGKIIAANRLRNQVRIVEQHVSEMRRRNKKNNNWLQGLAGGQN